MPNPRAEARKGVRGHPVLQAHPVPKDRQDHPAHRGLQDRAHAGPPVHPDPPVCLDVVADHPVVPWAAAVRTGRLDVEEW